ncbi:MAG: uroporphyrinogen decarboxylase family protein [Bryobacterales bacterium]|nr:uroporphyrinogen decarboxylase family protein [Bryobacterales bacterium]
MKPRDRILAMLEGRATDCLPLMPITMMFAGDTAGVRYGDYARDHRRLVEAQLKTAERYSFDYVSAISDPAREASDFGAAIEWFDDQPPAIIESRALLTEKTSLVKLPHRSLGPRMEDRVRAIQALKAAVGHDLLVEGWVEGPCALAADFRGVNTLMTDFADDPVFVEELFQFCVDTEIHFAQRQIEAGADLIGIGDAAASLVGPRIYRQFVLPYEQKLIAGIQAAGGKTRLHICGNTRRVLKEMGTTGANMIDLDYPSPMNEGRAAMGPNQPLLGNLDPVRIVRDGTPAIITEALQACFEAAGPRFLVGAGCEIPRGTPPENIEAMARFARTR